MTCLVMGIISTLILVPLGVLIGIWLCIRNLDVIVKFSARYK